MTTWNQARCDARTGQCRVGGNQKVLLVLVRQKRSPTEWLNGHNYPLDILRGWALLHTSNLYRCRWSASKTTSSKELLLPVDTSKIGQRTRTEKRVPDPTKGREPTPAKEKSIVLLENKDPAEWISDGPRPDGECVDYVWLCHITTAEFGSPYKPDTYDCELRRWGMTETEVISENATFSDAEARPVRLSSGWRSCCKCKEMSNPVTSQKEPGQCLNCSHSFRDGDLDCPDCVIVCWVKRRTAGDDDDAKLRDRPKDSTKYWPKGSREYWPLATRAGRPLGPFNETPMWWKCAARGCPKYGWFEKYHRFLLWGKGVEGSPRCCDGAERHGSPWVFNHFGVCLGKLDGSVVAIGGPWYWHILWHSRSSPKEASDCTLRSRSPSAPWYRKHIPGFDILGFKEMRGGTSRSTYPIIRYCQETEETPSVSNHEQPHSARHSENLPSRSSRGKRSEDNPEYFGVSTDEPRAPRTRTSTSQTFYEYYVPRPQYPLAPDPDVPSGEEYHSRSAAYFKLAEYLRSPEYFRSAEYFRLVEYLRSREYFRSAEAPRLAERFNRGRIT
ncbi:hypothetical protein QBC46DRAFT_452797 [Diplogelasinospora grovesii]|uniref:Uncharacterized protein n=1 Tax=Diplogelasinospora grovesii TaxID=303347 RepID=A0AAN6N080_9PEZI|nr:hypothetical protein QBC46DRAFT_452797 [Diplogelasinospora grovesii]